MKRQPAVEVYLRDCPMEKIVVWLGSAVGPLAGPLDCGAAVAYHPAVGSVVITPGIAGGPFVGVWFNTPNRPWATDAECARAVVSALGCVARCDPGAEFPDVPAGANVWLEVAGTTERLVVWE